MAEFSYLKYMPSMIKSIQRGVTTTPNSGSAQAATIAEVDTEKAVPLWHTFRGTDPIDTSRVRVELASPTSLEVSGRHSDAKVWRGVTVYWSVVEFNQVKSIQTGRGNGIINLSPINIEKAFPLILGCDFAEGSSVVGITSLTTDTITTNGPSHSIAWAVIEFY